MKFVLLVVLSFLSASCMTDSKHEKVMLDSNVVKEKRSIIDIQNCLEHYKNSVYPLYQKALESNQNMGGSITVSFIITSAGMAKNIKFVKSDLGDESLDNAIVSELKNLNCGPKGVEDAEIEYKFIFSPE